MPRVGGVGDEADLKRPPMVEVFRDVLELALDGVGPLAELVLKRRIIIATNGEDDAQFSNTCTNKFCRTSTHH